MIATYAAENRASKSAPLPVATSSTPSPAPRRRAPIHQELRPPLRLTMPALETPRNFLSPDL